MIRRGVKIQLVAFVVIAIVAIGYAVVRFAGAGELVNKPFHLNATFASAAGLEPKDEVDLLGVPVGSVSSLEPDGSDVIVHMKLSHDIKIPAAVSAQIQDKSALGEQYVLLTPKTAAGPMLIDDASIPLKDTSGPVPIADLLGNLDALAKSVPQKDLQVDLTETAKAFSGSGSDLSRLLDNGNALTKTALSDLNQTISLINSGNKVLTTQVDESNAVKQGATSLAGFTREVRTLDPTLASLFLSGLQTGRQLTGLLKDNQTALSGLLSGLLTTTDVTNAHLPQLRKTLALYPWIIQVGATAIRYCDNHDLQTGKAIASTCHYDPKTHQRIYTGHFAFQLPQAPDGPPYNPCTQGYGGTKQYLPDEQPANGVGPNETSKTKPNYQAQCTAKPSDPNAPNVRGAQNAQHPAGDHGTFPSSARASTTKVAAVAPPAILRTVTFIKLIAAEFRNAF
jgi:phospholipid/cholesterol/gamma-HCH transport system substrate-binding protein